MFLPSHRMLRAAGVLAAAGVVVSAVPELVPVWAILAGALIAAAGYDALRLRSMPAPQVSRQVPGSLALGVEREVVLNVDNPCGHTLETELYDHHPSTFEALGMPRRLRLLPQGSASVCYRIRPVARGTHRFARAQLRLSTSLGFWQRALRSGSEDTVRVYPNFAALAGYALLATDNRLSRIGVLERQRRGEGIEFHQLREYREGDAQRQIDWKASARSYKLISREYQDERDQTVIILLDCGRRMAAQDDALSHFDHALNAALLLAHASLRQGDAVGLMTMGGPERWLAPRKSASAVNLVLDRVYDLAPTLRTPDYHAAAVALMGRVKKRALIVILSNLRDEDDDTLAPALRLLLSRHLVLLASLREAILGRALLTRVDGLDRALTHASAAHSLRQRALAFRRMERSGAVCVDADPQQLPVTLVNRYLQIKRERSL